MVKVGDPVYAEPLAVAVRQGRPGPDGLRRGRDRDRPGDARRRDAQGASPRSGSASISPRRRRRRPALHREHGPGRRRGVPATDWETRCSGRPGRTPGSAASETPATGCRAHRALARQRPRGGSGSLHRDVDRARRRPRRRHRRSPAGSTPTSSGVGAVHPRRRPDHDLRVRRCRSSSRRSSPCSARWAGCPGGRRSTRTATLYVSLVRGHAADHPAALLLPRPAPVRDRAAGARACGDLRRWRSTTAPT